MNVEFTKRFKKDFNRFVNISNLAVQLDKAIENILQAKNVNEINNLKKLHGYKHYYRIRIGSYRIGIKIINDTFIFSAFDHRKDIYSHFP